MCNSTTSLCVIWSRIVVGLSQVNLLGALLPLDSFKFTSLTNVGLPFLSNGKGGGSDTVLLDRWNVFDIIFAIVSRVRAAFTNSGVFFSGCSRIMNSFGAKLQSRKLKALQSWAQQFKNVRVLSVFKLVKMAITRPHVINWIYMVKAMYFVSLKLLGSFLALKA